MPVNDPDQDEKGSMRKYRIPLAVALLASVILGTDVSVPAAAAPGLTSSSAASQERSLGTGGVGNSPFSPEEQARRAAARRDDLPKGDALTTLAEDGQHLAVTDARAPHLADSGTAAIDPVTWEECADHEYDNGENAYWFKNKYNLCRLELFTITYRELINNIPVVVGQSRTIVELKGTAVDGQSSINFSMRMRDFEHVNKTHKEWVMSIQLPCGNADPGRISDCTEPSGESTVYRMPIQQWEAQAGTEYHWTKNTSTTANPDVKYHDEMRGYFDIGLYFALESPLGPDVAFSPAELLRCDSATYVFGSKCVVARVSSVLEFSASDPTLAESARFIRDAQNDITLTKPGTPGKRVPGAPGGTPLHRLYSAYDAHNDIKASRRRVPKTCRLYWGPRYTAGGTKQCDEYPFATTYENSARIDTSTVFDYAVRAIKKEHNETAGRAYGAWLGADHILDGDPFFVRIVP